MEKEASDWHRAVFDMYIAAGVGTVVELVGQKMVVAADCNSLADEKAVPAAGHNSNCSEHQAPGLSLDGSCDRGTALEKTNAPLELVHDEASQVLLPGI